MRLPRPYPGELAGSAELGDLGVLVARDGYTAIAQEINKDQWIVSFVPKAVTRGVSGGVVDLALKAIVAAVNAIAKAAKKQGGGDADVEEAAKSANAAKAAADNVGCDGGPCSCRGAPVRGWF